MSRDYRKIVAWQRTHQLTLRIYKKTKAFPSEERFGLWIDEIREKGVRINRWSDGPYLEWNHR